MFQNLLNKVGLGGLPGNFAYTVGDQVNLPFQSIWTFHKGHKKADGSPVSVFVCPKKDISPSTLARAQNAEKVSKMLRYPNVLRAFDSIEVDGGVYIVTEAVMPLLSADTEADGEVAVYGLYQALDALNFLHTNGFTHGLFGPAAIFVTSRGDYRLAGFDLCQKGADISSLLSSQRQCGPCLSGWPEVPKALASGGVPAQAIDFWGATVLMAYVFGSARARRAGPDYKPDLTRAAQEIPAELREGFANLQKYGPLRGNNPVGDIIGLPYFLSQSAVIIMQFLGNLHIKSQEEKESFFEGLPAMLEDVSQATQTKQLLPELLDAQKFPGNESAQVLPAILKIGVKLKEEDFKEKVAPLVVQLFTSPDRAIRFRAAERLLGCDTRYQATHEAARTTASQQIVHAWTCTLSTIGWDPHPVCNAHTLQFHRCRSLLWVVAPPHNIDSGARGGECHTWWSSIIFRLIPTRDPRGIYETWHAQLPCAIIRNARF